VQEQLEGWFTAFRFLSATGFEMALVLAAFCGPIVAVRIERKLAIEREAKARRIEVFRTLLGHRGYRLSPVYVQAFNVVPLEFHESKYKDVREKWTEHLDVLSELPPAEGDTANHDALGRRSRESLHALLLEMASALGYSFSKRELERDVYWPKAFNDLEREQRDVRLSIIKALDPSYGVPVQMRAKDKHRPQSSGPTSIISGDQR